MEKKLHRYTLRLGNSRYPFMKLVLQEVLIEGEYFLTIDTHDSMEVKPDYPDYAAWQKLKVFNAELKAKIEARWNAEKLPTYDTLSGLARELIPEDFKGQARGRILVVDDEKNIRETIAAMLAARGYWVETAADGEDAVEKIGEMLPDLVIMDYEMPKMDGLAAIEKVRANKRTKNVPILLATAGQVALDKVQLANGFMVKPFQREVLFQFVEHLASASKNAAKKSGVPGLEFGGKAMRALWQGLSSMFSAKIKISKRKKA